MIKRLALISALIVSPFVASAATFDDTDVTHPNYNAIEYLAEQGVVEGYVEGENVLFKPYNSVTRVAALKMLLLTADIAPETPSVELPYSDTDAGAWYEGYLFSATEFGIVEGFPDGTFRPGQEVTQAEYLAMILRAFGQDVSDLEEDGDQWYDPYYRFARAYNLIDVTDPGAALTRGEVAELTFRMSKVEDDDYEAMYVYFGRGEASYYHPSLAGNSTASGEPYDPEAMTAAHRTLPFGTQVKVTNDAGQSIIVTINDRGPYHEARVLDLSEAAFRQLAPQSAGIVDVDYEVILELQATEIPEEIAALLDEDTTLTPVPIEIQRNLDAESGEKKNDDAGAIVPRKLNLIDVRPEGGKISYGTFSRFVMGRDFPTSVYVGEVLEFYGILHDSGPEKATVFLQAVDPYAPTQPYFSAVGTQFFDGPVSYRSFRVPVHFLEPGNYRMGVIFDDKGESELVDVLVLPRPNYRGSGLAESFHQDVEIRAEQNKEGSLLSFEWDLPEVTTLSRLIVRQRDEGLTFFIGQSMNDLDIPVEYFWRFDFREPIQIDLAFADSEEATQESRISKWHTVYTEPFLLTESFPLVLSDAIEVYGFDAFVNQGAPIELIGRVRDVNVRIDDLAYLQRPDGSVDALPIEFGDNRVFTVRAPALTPGTYVIELLDQYGDRLWQRPAYVRQSGIKMLPALPFPTESAPNTNIAGVQYWVNSLRAEYGLRELKTDVSYAEDAQAKAQQLVFTPSEFKSESWLVSGEARQFDQVLQDIEMTPHLRQRILQSKWRYMGVGVVQKNQDQDFGVVVVFSE